MPSHGRRVVIQLDRFMYLGESFKAILKEHEIDPTYYDEAMSSVDAFIWQGVMEVELESIILMESGILYKNLKGQNL